MTVSDGHTTLNVVVTDSYARVESHEAVEAAFLLNPDEVAEAIKLAMELARQPPPMQMMMAPPPGPTIAMGVPTVAGKS